MASEVVSEHIQLTLRCLECGHEWDVDDYDANCMASAKDNASTEKCPQCEESS